MTNNRSADPSSHPAAAPESAQAPADADRGGGQFEFWQSRLREAEHVWRHVYGDDCDPVVARVAVTEFAGEIGRT